MQPNHLTNGLTRRTLLLAGAAATAAGWAPLARAQGTWPSRPVKLIVPFAPGGSNDILARVIADKMGARIGQPVVVDNKGGASGTIGTDFVAKAAPDGHTLLFASGSITTNAAAGKKLPYDLVNDLEPIGAVAAGPYVIVVSNNLPVTNLREFIELARAKPRTIDYGSAGTGGMNHLGTELFANAAKLQLVHVPYKGIGPAFSDLMGGNLQMALPSLASVIPHLRGGRMRALAITSEQRSPLAPDLPTVSEAGLPGFKFDVWWGLLGPAKMPASVLKRLNEELNAVLGLPEVRELFAREGAATLPTSPDQFRSMVRSEITRWTQLIKDANIVME
jgi:tripartite-type tricarboxylate transporter receptor subunit TctC